MAPPSRRSLLGAVGVGAVGALAGCLAGDGSGDEPTTDPPTVGTPTGETPVTDDPPDDRPPADGEAPLSVVNHGDSPATVAVTVRRDGETVHEGTLSVNGGVGRLVTSVGEPGTYAVTASVDGGGSVEYDWRVGDDYAGRLRIVVGEPDGPTVTETVSGLPCPSGDGARGSLPYAAPDAPETYEAGGATLRNESGEPVTVTFSVADGSEQFFECTYEMSANRTITVDPLTATAGEYTVTVDVEGRGRTVYDWRIPPDHNWPELLVTVPAEGDPVVGCGQGGVVPVSVENATGSSATATLGLRRDGETVATASVDLAAGASASRDLSTPVGDVYELVVDAPGGTARADVPQCYCYTAYETTVTLAGDGPAVDTDVRVCT